MKKQALINKLEKQIVTADTFRMLGTRDKITQCVILTYVLLHNCVIIMILAVYKEILIVKYHLLEINEYCCKLFKK